LISPLLKLAKKDVRVKATGFGRVDFDVRSALTDLYVANPRALSSALTFRPHTYQGLIKTTITRSF